MVCFTLAESREIKSDEPSIRTNLASNLNDDDEDNHYADCDGDGEALRSTFVAFRLYGASVWSSPSSNSELPNICIA